MSQESAGVPNKAVRFIKVAVETFKVYLEIAGAVLAFGLVSGGWGFIQSSVPFVIIGFLAVVTAASLIGVLAYRANNNPKQDVKVLKRYVTYRYVKDEGPKEHTKTYKIIAMTDNVESFIDRYKWSCDIPGKCEVSLLTPHQSLIQRREAEWFINEIRFDPPLAKAQKAEIALRWDLDCRGLAVPFLSQIIDYPTDYLELSAFTPEEPKEVWFIHFHSGDGIDTLESTKTKKEKGTYYRATGEMKYTIDKPINEHKYMIKWVP